MKMIAGRASAARLSLRLRGEAGPMIHGRRVASIDRPLGPLPAAAAVSARRRALARFSAWLTYVTRLQRIELFFTGTLRVRERDVPRLMDYFLNCSGRARACVCVCVSVPCRARWETREQGERERTGRDAAHFKFAAIHLGADCSLFLFQAPRPES